jgi:glycerol-3-phosphate acyltransferase PlsY
VRLTTLFYPLFGYLLGSLPFALWVIRFIKGTDIRAAGSGHVTTTNTIRQAGWVPGALVAILDIAKGFIPTYLSYRAGLPDWLVAVTAAFAVIGHCWPIFADFRGGMGLATTAGSVLAVSPLGFLIGLGVLIFFVLVVKHGARGSVVAALVAPPLAWALGLRGTVIWVGVAVALVIAIRFYFEDWDRKYRELWLDRDQENHP